MPKASKRNQVTSKKDKYATRQFTDRNTLKEAYSNALKLIKQKETYVLNFYGFGGIGKTRLMKELQFIDRDLLHIKHIELDFKLKANADMMQALINLRDSFRKELSIKFNYFDLAYVHYMQASSPQIALKQNDLPFIENGDLLWDIISEIQSVPIIGCLGSVIKLGHKAKNTIEKNINSNIKSHLDILYDLKPYEVFENLPYYFAMDVQIYLEKNPADQIVIFFDTYEALWDAQFSIGHNDQLEKWIKDIFIPEMKNVLFVILGRDKLRWENNDREWEEYLEQHLLNELSNEDATDFLKACAIDDTDIVDRILGISKGLPLALDLCVDSYERIQTDRQPSVDDFSLDLKMNDLIQRIVGHLNHYETELVELLAVVRYWDSEVLFDIITGFNISISKKGALFLEELSFIHFDDELKIYKMHDIACEFLEGQVLPELKETLYIIMIKHYEHKLMQMPMSHSDYVFTLNEVLRYACKLDHKNAETPWYIHKAENIQEMGRGQSLKKNLLTLFDKKQMQHDLIGIILANIYFDEGSYQNALQILENLTCETSMAQKLKVQTMIGRIYHRLYVFNKAADCYKLVDDTNLLNPHSIDDHTVKILIENGIRYSKLLLQMSMPKEAEMIQMKTYNRITSHHQTHQTQKFLIDQARLLEKMCELQFELGNLDLAEHHGKEGVFIYNELADSDQSNILSVRFLQDKGLLNKRLAELAVKRKRYEIAIQYYNKSIACYDDALKIDDLNNESYRRKGFAARGFFRTLCKIEGYTPNSMKIESIARHAFIQSNQINTKDASTVNALGGLINIKVNLFIDENPNEAIELIHEALSYFESSNKINHKYPYAYNHLAESYYNLALIHKDHDESYRFIEQAKSYITKYHEVFENTDFMHRIESNINAYTLMHFSKK